ncbi:MAG TPA: bifunctional 3-deoxy-7-phosphoheptulonate synthase/chorismate mutase type II [Flavipsychrobacter sp.]|nr:bifunctional 3-deoxy-7-phosphoheptulonate synthase/chorismate mutase type II [Flavipsychrobacter sp.]
MSFFRIAEEPLIIAGPCSAETREQVIETAAALKDISVNLYRAGVWKPRTKPGTFEGNGEQALQWLQEVKENYQLPVTVEVAEVAHIELALKYKIDVLWIGARTVVNPFHVQQLADALKGVDIPVMVKNPVNPDVDLWEGAIERFERAGITKIAAIHRGFSSYQSSSQYRNQPNWVIPIELKRRRPDMYIICDPSHIAGKRNLVAEVSQKALDMGFDGLMIETHPNPERAWSDAAQQLTPHMLKEMLQQLIIRKHFTADMSKSTELEYLRQLMDTVDAEIVDLLARRMELSARMGTIKKGCNMTVYNPDRWRDIVETRTEQAIKLNLSPDFILALYEKIHHESIKKQLALLEAKDKLAKD